MGAVEKERGGGVTKQCGTLLILCVMLKCHCINVSSIVVDGIPLCGISNF